MWRSAAHLRLSAIHRELLALPPELRQRYPIAYLGIIGSWVRGEQTAAGDLDLLVGFDGPIDLFAFARLQEEIGQRLDVRVDLGRACLTRAYRDFLADSGAHAEARSVGLAGQLCGRHREAGATGTADCRWMTQP